jgi:hypothetical protein
MGRDTAYAMEVRGERKSWQNYDGVPYFSSFVSSGLPRYSFEALDTPLRTRIRWTREEIGERLRSLRPYKPPSTLLGIFLELDDLAPGFDDDLALRLFLEFLVVEMAREGADAVYIRRE